MFTEFTRVDGAIRAWERELRAGQTDVPPADRPGRLDRLVFSPEERPLVAQLWGTRPEEFERAARAIEKLGFDGIDVNMGCPARKIRKAGACSALIAHPALAGEIIHACRSGTSLPVSIKTRIGLDRVVTEEWIGYLLEQRVEAITIHGRIADQLSEGVADWNEVARAVRLRDSLVGKSTTAIIGNGDVMSVRDGYQRIAKTGVDGVMVGRGIFSDPLFFARASERPREIPGWHQMSLSTRLDYLREQIVAFTDNYGDRRNYEILKKFFRNYLCVSQDPDSDADSDADPAAGDLLERLYETHHSAAALEIIDDFREQYR
jgi:tRNA-dihydrouridine synthase